MPAELKLPLLGDVMTEGTVVEWLAEDGAAVRRGDPLYQLETDKVSYTVEAPEDGRLQQIASAGSTLPVGSLVGRLLDSSVALGTAPASSSPAAGQSTSSGQFSPDVAEEQPRTAPAADLSSPRLDWTPERAELRITPAARRLARELGISLDALPQGKRLREADVQAAHDARPPASATAAMQQAAIVNATPAARRFARALGVDLERLSSNGRRLRTADVLAAAHTRATSEPAGSTPAAPTQRAADVPAPPTTVVELAGRRGVIAQRMHASLRDMAQLTLGLEADMTTALALRHQLKTLWPEEQQPTVTDLVLRALILALQEHPALNATLEGTTLRTHGHIDVGLAVDAEAGLVVPVLHHAGALSLRELAPRTRDLAMRARENRLRAEDIAGGTFTLTNLGTLGVTFFTPIINPPQVAILGLGCVSSRLSLAAGQVTEHQSMTLSLTIDHRAMDGAPAARFLNTIKRNLELPAALLA